MEQAPKYRISINVFISYWALGWLLSHGVFTGDQPRESEATAQEDFSRLSSGPTATKYNTVHVRMCEFKML
jgi:hypothetical protein